MDASGFVDLRRIADWFSTSPQRPSIHVERAVARLGVVAVPLLGRELQSEDPRRRDASRALLARLADVPAVRSRVIAELRSIARDGDQADDSKVSAIGLLSELGEHAEARFADPTAIQLRSALALAAQLATDADVASAADLMVRKLDEDDIAQMLEIMIPAAPTAAERLAGELLLRLDLPAESRERIATTMLASRSSEPPAEPAARRTQRPRATRSPPPRPPEVAVLVDGAARLVVVASKKVHGERRWRRWAVLINARGRLDDCLHQDDSATTADAASLIASLCADGYRVASTDVEHARNLVSTAARLSATTLTSNYYLGRDLLDLRDVHLGGRRASRSSTLARAIELVSDGDHAKAEVLLASCDPAHPEVAAATAVIHLARRDAAAAITALERALAAEPDWPLHHWNLAVAQSQLGDSSACFHALRKFVATSSHATVLAVLGTDPDQRERLASAQRWIAELERSARVTGTSLRRRRRRSTTAKVRRTPA